MGTDARLDTDMVLGRQPEREGIDQDRSAIRRRRIADGAILAISRHGIASLTHRQVAEAASVSLAATTYHYASKADIIADASRTLLGRYTEAFHRFAGRQRDDPTGLTLRDFADRLVLNATGRHAAETLAWCEIVLNAATTPALIDISRSWFEALEIVWRNIAQLLGEDDAERSATSAIDLVIGFLFLVVPLGLSEDQLAAVLAGSPPASVQGPEESVEAARSGGKGRATRQRVLDAAVSTLIEDGAEALTFRHVSQRAGLTVAAPTYHFPTISALWNAAQLRLFELAKDRYRSVMGGVDYATLDVDRLIDLTTTVFVREATEFRKASLASYPVYVHSRRDPSLRPGLRAINAEQWRRWRQVLDAVHLAANGREAWAMYAIFTGKLIRILATGAETADLAKVRSEFSGDLRAIADASHWSLSEKAVQKFEKIDRNRLPA